MDQIEQALQAGRNLETPADLSAGLKGAVDAEIAATAAGAATSATQASGWSWAPVTLVGAAIILIATASVTIPFWLSNSNSTTNESESELAAVDPELVDSEVATSEFDAASASTSTTGDGVDASSSTDVAAEDDPLNGAAIYGVVRDAWGAPLPEARVKVVMKDGFNEVSKATVTDGDGAYEVSVGELKQRLNAKIAAKKEEEAAAVAQRVGELAEVSSLALEERARAEEELAQMLMRQEEMSKRLADLGTTVYLPPSEAQASDGAADAVGGFAIAVSESAVVPDSDQMVVWAAPDGSGQSFLLQGADGGLRVRGVGADSVPFLVDSHIPSFRGRRGSDGVLVSVSATATGHRTSVERHFHFKENHRKRVDFALEEGFPLDGKVVDQDQQPISGAVVNVLGSLGALAEGEHSAETNEAGEFRFRALPAGVLILEVSASGRRSQLRLLETGGEPVVFELESSASLRAFVVDDRGEPARRARVELLRDGDVIAEGRCDREGLVFFDGLQGGAIELLATRRGGVYPAAEERISLVVGETTETEVTLDEPVRVAGQLVIPESDYKGRYMILAYSQGDRAHAQERPSTWADESGAFEFSDGLLPGSYVFAIATRQESRWGFRMLTDVEIRPGRTAQNLRFEFAAAEPARIEVRVQNTEGQAIANASVRMDRERTGSSATRRTNKDGVYAIDLHPDVFELGVEAKGYEAQVFTDVNLRGGEQRVFDVVLKPAANLSEALAQLIRDDTEVFLHKEASWRAVVQLVNEVEPGLVALERRLEEWSGLEDAFVPGKPGLTLTDLLKGFIQQCDLEWQIDSGQLYLELPE